MTPLKPTVMKFGGTSVEDAPAFERVARIVASHRELRPVVVVSAMSGMTDALLTSARRAANSEPQAAISSLDQHFERHAVVAQTLLAKDEATELVSRIQSAREEIIELLQAIAAQRKSTAALLDIVLAYGERLSSALLTAAST